MIDLDFALDRLNAWGIEARYPNLDDFDGEFTLEELPRNYIFGDTSFYTVTIRHRLGVDSVGVDLCFHHSGDPKNLQEFLAQLSGSISELETALDQILMGKEVYEERVKHGLD